MQVVSTAPFSLSTVFLKQPPLWEQWADRTFQGERKWGASSWLGHLTVQPEATSFQWPPPTPWQVISSNQGIFCEGERSGGEREEQSQEHRRIKGTRRREKRGFSIFAPQRKAISTWSLNSETHFQDTDRNKLQVYKGGDRHSRLSQDYQASNWVKRLVK